MVVEVTVLVFFVPGFVAAVDFAVPGLFVAPGVVVAPDDLVAPFVVAGVAATLAICSGMHFG